MRCARPSLEPMVTIASRSMSMSTSQRRLYHWQMARRSRGMPLETEYPCVSSRCATSTSLSTMWRGVAPSGFPIDRSMMSSPARRAAIFSSLVMLKTYGGRRLMRENSGTMGCDGSLRFMRRMLRCKRKDSSVKIERDSPEGRNTFTGYGAGYVEVSGKRHTSSLVVSADRLVTDWPASSVEALGADHLAAILELKPAIAILGTGPTL